MALIGYSVTSSLFPVWGLMIVSTFIFLWQKAIAPSSISIKVPSILLLSKKRAPWFDRSPKFSPGTTTAIIAICGRYPWGYIPKFITAASVGIPFLEIDNISYTCSSDNFENPGLLIFIVKIYFSNSSFLNKSNVALSIGLSSSWTCFLNASYE